MEWAKHMGSLRRSALAAGTVALVGPLALAWAAMKTFGLSEWYAVKIVMVYGVVMVTATTLLSAHHPFPRFGPANQVTTIRTGFVAIVAAMVGEPASASGA